MLRRALTFLFILAAVVFPAWADDAPAPAAAPDAAPDTKKGDDKDKGLVTVELGKAVYEKRCLGCHGEKGAGDGPAASRFKPVPRDFTKGLFKYKTTPHGSPPTDDDLIRTVTEGLPGTGMPAWKSIIKENQIRSVGRAA